MFSANPFLAKRVFSPKKWTSPRTLQFSWTGGNVAGDRRLANPHSSYNLGRTSM
jgi:hypothetical protein